LVKAVPSPPLVARIVATAALLAGATGMPPAAAVGHHPPSTLGLPRAGSPAAAPGAASTRAMTAGAPRTYRLKLRTQYQATDYYCVPASIAMSLSTFGVTVDQRTLAAKMRTTVRGTGDDNATKVIDAYIHPRRYDDRLVSDVVGHPGVLMDRIAYDVGTLRRAPVIQVWMERLPWNRATVRGRQLGHAIIAYGYDRTSGTVTIFDPWRPTGGSHTVTAGALAGMLQGGGMHYISRL
jgi:hypothetical protein